MVELKGVRSFVAISARNGSKCICAYVRKQNVSVLSFYAFLGF